MFAEPLFVALGRRVAGTSGSERAGAAGWRVGHCPALPSIPVSCRRGFAAISRGAGMEGGFFFRHKQIQGQRHGQLSHKGFKVWCITVECRLLSFPTSRPPCLHQSYSKPLLLLFQADHVLGAPGVCSPCSVFCPECHLQTPNCHNSHYSHLCWQLAPHPPHQPVSPHTPIGTSSSHWQSA